MKSIIKMKHHALLALLLSACSGNSFAVGQTFGTDAAERDGGIHADSQTSGLADAGRSQSDALPPGNAGSAGMGTEEIDSGAGGSPETGGSAAFGGNVGIGGSPAAGSGGDEGKGGASPFVHCDDPIPCASCIIPNGVMTVLSGCCRTDHVCGYLWDGNCGPATASGCPY